MSMFFLSGLPRSGSQVLASIMNQHPKLHATTTSAVADLFISVAEQWPNLSKAMPNKDPRILINMLGGMLRGSYQHHGKRHVLDKNRRWPRFSSDLALALGERPKIVCTVRSIPDILASYLLLIDKNPVNFVDQTLEDRRLLVNKKNRCTVILDTFINHPYASLRIGEHENAADRLYVEYNQLVKDPHGVIANVCDFLEVDRFEVNTTQLQPMDENDEAHGLMVGLHDVRPILARTSPSADFVLGEELYEFYSKMKLEFWRRP